MFVALSLSLSCVTGNWNERPWGPPEWTVSYKAAMENIGFGDTKIIIPDGGDSAGVEKAMAASADFEAAVDGIGVHYPCNRPVPSIGATYGKKYWSSEDYSTVGDWAGAACWGRLLNQNYLRMNQTSTISWSLIWSVYPEGFPYFGNGLMYVHTLAFVFACVCMVSVFVVVSTGPQTQSLFSFSNNCAYC